MLKTVTYECEKCSQQFSNINEAESHEDECNTVFKCDCCGKEMDLSNDTYGTKNEGCHEINLGRMGYGSGLDGSDVNFNLCDECLINLVNSFPLEAQAKIYNSGSNKWGTDEDWIKRQDDEMKMMAAYGVKM
ncbi:hypothetical protein GCM10008931_43800 [Oceanobacillus oncorhynchi subsp. oncorhynchi]|uniref:hypothetical protein n=1 Tax=Oceanobacillus oncorhynchi TaxID=545501 RepID=UPI0031DDD43E